ncbi:MAG TPA: transposase [Anaerolineales bacterium]
MADTGGMSTQSEFSRQASLVLVGEYVQGLGIWSVIEQHVTIKQKIRQHTPLAKLLDAFITILAGGHGLVESNTRVRPDPIVQAAFGRRSCAEQSTISRMLTACSPANVDQMRDALQAILRQQGRCYQHHYERAWQVLDVDLTGLVAGRQGEGVTKGYFAHQRSQRGRQLGRVLATDYGELVVEQLYPGQRQLERGFTPLLEAAEKVLDLTDNRRARTIVRADGGAGSDANINWALHRSYHLLTKVHNWQRAMRLARTVTAWYPDDSVPERELGWVTQPAVYAQPTRQVAIRYHQKNKKGELVWRHHILVTTLTDPMVFTLLGQDLPPTLDDAMRLRAIAHAYDLRDGALETENRGDKQGLGLSHRNKRSFAAQEMLVLLAELAHNVTVWAQHRLTEHDPRFHKFGIQRMVRDVFQIDGQATLSSERQVVQVVLNPLHPYAAAVAAAFG